MANGDLLGGPPISQPPQIPMQKFQCITCKSEVVARMPMPMIFNQATVSGVVFAHERITRCQHCQTPYVPLVGACTPEGQIQLMWTPLPGHQPAVRPATEAELDAMAKTKMKM